jgi:hypothetical protein
MATVPTRKTSERELDLFNQQFRSSPLYQKFMTSRGLPTDGHAKLSRKQQSDLETAMARAGFKVPSGMHIDQGGNLNQKNRLLRNVGIGAALAAGTIATLGATGVIAGGVGGGFGLGSGAAGVASVPGAVGGTLPGAVAAGVPTVGAGVGGASTAAASAAMGIGAWGGGAGVGTAAAAPLLSAPVIGAAAAPVGYAATTPAVSSAAGGGMGASTWFDIGKEGAKGAFDWFGGRSANKANERASEIMGQGNAAELAFEREKEARRQYEWEQAEAAKKRNVGIEEEERLDEMRRLEEQEAQREPIRLAKEEGYRQYMKKWYGLDVGPSVARTPRQFGVTPGTKQPVTDITAPQPLAAQAEPGAGYGSIVPAETPDVAGGGMSVDPWFIQQGQQDAALKSRRSIGQGDY